jgi:hypothetical protein
MRSNQYNWSLAQSTSRWPEKIRKHATAAGVCTPAANGSQHPFGNPASEQPTVD